MGRYWYEEQGKYLNKRNTFSDFIACAEYLVENNYTKPELLACEGRLHVWPQKWKVTTTTGRSAGGLLMGNVVNMRPDLFQVCTVKRCAVALSQQRCLGGCCRRPVR